MNTRRSIGAKYASYCEDQRCAVPRVNPRPSAGCRPPLLAGTAGLHAGPPAALIHRVPLRRH
eukprot:7350457-Lingulodinium_polyedra.AAC.1